MIAPPGLAAHEQPRDGGHHVVVAPQSAHCEVRARRDPHRLGIRVLAGRVEVHGEQVPVAFLDGRFAQPGQGIAEVQVHAVLERAHTMARLDLFARRSGRDVSRGQVAVRRVLTFQVVIALVLRNLMGRALIVGVCGHPDPTIVTQRLTHQRGLGLPVRTHRQRGRVELDERGRGEIRPALVRPPGRGHIGVVGERGAEVHVAVAARAQHHGVRGLGFDLAGVQIAAHHALRAAVLDDQVQHLAVRA